MFSIIQKEMKWRREIGLPEGFDTLKKSKPLVAVGADGPLGDELIIADYFRTFLRSLSTPANKSNLDGKDGLGGIHETVMKTEVFTRGLDLNTAARTSQSTRYVEEPFLQATILLAFD